MITVAIKRLDPELEVPRHQREGDAAVDLPSRVDVLIEPGERKLVPTGFAVAIPVNAAGLILPRSGLALKQGVTVANGPGLIDSGYRGEVKVILINVSGQPVSIERGQRIAQLLVIPVPDLSLELVDELPPAPDERGVQGFGSSGY